MHAAATRGAIALGGLLASLLVIGVACTSASQRSPATGADVLYVSFTAGSTTIQTGSVELVAVTVRNESGHRLAVNDCAGRRLQFQTELFTSTFRQGVVDLFRRCASVEYVAPGTSHYQAELDARYLSRTPTASSAAPGMALPVGRYRVRLVPPSGEGFPKVIVQNILHVQLVGG